MGVPFNKPHFVGSELDYISEAVANAHISGNGPFSRRCTEHLEDLTNAPRVLLTHSCTAALEMAALLAGVGPGDEVIMPSFTFPSTATAFVLRGAVPVFVDIRDDTLNIDDRLVPEAVSDRTRAVVAVHYGGVGCEMDALRAAADEAGAVVIEDAAQGLGATWKGKQLGGFGEAGALSFHETKNVMSGEGGALVINEEEWVERGEILQEKGTNRRAFFRGEVDKYTWIDVGSSFLASDLTAAFLWAQLEHLEQINAARMEVWDRYHSAFAELEDAGRARRPRIPPDAVHNAHLYYLLLDSLEERDRLLARLAEDDVAAVFHYLPLHSSPAGARYGRAVGDLPVTTNTSDRLVRLPMWAGMTEQDTAEVIGSVQRALAA